MVQEEPEGGLTPHPVTPTELAAPGTVEPRKNRNPAVLPDLWMLFDTEWNIDQLAQMPRCTANLGRDCDSQAPLADIVKVIVANHC